MTPSTTSNDKKLDTTASMQLATLTESAVSVDVDERPDRPGLRGWLPLVILVALAILFILGTFMLPGREAKAGSAIFLMVTLMFMKVPLFFALTIPGLLGVLSISGIRAVPNVVIGSSYDAVTSWSLSVLPMFVLMGLLLWSSGLTSKLYDAARHWLAFLPGGLAVSTTVAGTGLAAVSGSTIGTTFAIARIGIPEMLRSGYDKRLAIGSIMVAGLPGQLIPPSIMLVIVAGLLEAPVGPLLIAGVIPGVAVSIFFCLALVIFAVVKPSWAGRGANRVQTETASWSERIRSLLWVLPVILLILIIFVGMFGGFATATEVGAIGAFCTIIFCVVLQWKNKPWQHVVRGIMTAASSVGAIFLLLMGAKVLAALLAISGLGRLFASFVVTLGLDRFWFLMLILLVFLILGTFMDPLAMMLLTLPILVPVLLTMDVSMLWFGVFVVFMAELAILTPPVGLLSYVIHGIVRDKEVNLGQKISLSDVFASLWLMFPMAVLFAIILIIFPEIATWLPGQMAQ